MKKYFKRKITIRLGAFCTGILLLSSCKVAYIPSMHNVPLLKEEGDITVHVTPTNFQGAYAVTGNIGLMLNGQFGGSSWNEGSGAVAYNSKRKFIEGAFGYYLFDAEKKSFEIFGGAGTGSLSFENDFDFSDPQKYHAKASKFFIQPSVGISKDYFDVAVAVKFVNLNFYNVEIDEYTEDELKFNKLYQLDKNPFVFIEPSITVRGGGKHFKAHLQYLYSAKVIGNDINYMSKYLFLGISLYF